MTENNEIIDAVQNIEIKHIYSDIAEIKKCINAINQSMNSLVKKGTKHDTEIKELKEYNERFLKYAMFTLAIITAIINFLFRIL